MQACVAQFSQFSTGKAAVLSAPHAYHPLFAASEGALKIGCFAGGRYKVELSGDGEKILATNTGQKAGWNSSTNSHLTTKTNCMHQKMQRKFFELIRVKFTHMELPLLSGVAGGSFSSSMTLGWRARVSSSSAYSRSVSGISFSAF